MKYLLVVILALSSTYTYSQRSCVAQEHLAMKPGKTAVAIEQSLSQRIQRNRLPNQQKIQSCSGGIYRVPVVVHVVHDNGPENITTTQINSQISVLNNDFRKKSGTPGNGPGFDAQIEFYLATFDPTGAPTSGVTRTRDSVLTYIDATTVTEDSLLKNLIQWPTNQYMNIYVVDSITYMGFEVFGYATLPSNGNDPYDGIVISDQYFGDSTGTGINSAPFHKGRTGTHEVGHWLGLYHTFNCVNPGFPCCEGTDTSNCDLQGDYICDTPPQFGSHGGCPTTFNTCTETPSDSPDSVNNYMDYVDDACMNAFTNGQVNMMQSTLNVDTGRWDISSSVNIVRTGVRYYGIPDAQFTAHKGNHQIPNPHSTAGLNNVIACTGDSVHFYDLSPGTMYDYMLSAQSPPTPDTKWEWKFIGATPDTSNAQNPIVSYASPGTYSVQLKIYNNNGICTTVKPGFITITGPQLTIGADTATVGDTTSFFSMTDQPGAYKWRFGDLTGTDTSSMSLPKYVYPSAGSYTYELTYIPEDTNVCVGTRYAQAIVNDVVLSLPIRNVSIQCDPEGSSHLEWTWFELFDDVETKWFLDGSVDGHNYARSIVNPADIKSQGNSYHWEFQNRDKRWKYIKLISKSGDESFTSRVMVNECETNGHARLFPTIADEHICVDHSDLELYAIEVIDMRGRNYSVQAMNSTSNCWEIESLPSGMYLVKIYWMDSQETEVFRFFKL